MSSGGGNAGSKTAGAGPGSSLTTPAQPRLNAPSTAGGPVDKAEKLDPFAKRLSVTRKKKNLQGSSRYRCGLLLSRIKTISDDRLVT